MEPVHVLLVHSRDITHGATAVNTSSAVIPRSPRPTKTSAPRVRPAAKAPTGCREVAGCVSNFYLDRPGKHRLCRRDPLRCHVAALRGGEPGKTPKSPARPRCRGIAGPPTVAAGAARCPAGCGPRRRDRTLHQLRQRRAHRQQAPPCDPLRNQVRSGFESLFWINAAADGFSVPLLPGDRSDGYRGV